MESGMGQGQDNGQGFGSDHGPWHDHKIGHGHHADWKAQDVGELLSVVTEKVPELVAKLLHTLYSEDAAKEMGKAVGSLYKELVSSGIPTEMALKMTSDYMFSLKDLTHNGFINHNITHSHQER